jgi:pyrroline-5-carboxylate reductase
MYETIGFIGAGRVARIMLGGWQRAGKLPGQIRVHDPCAEAVAALQVLSPGVKVVSLAEAAGADLVFGALHPAPLLEVLPRIVPLLKPSAVFCSLSPKVKLTTLREKLEGFGRLVRQNPNAPSVVGAGYNPIAFARALPATERAALLTLLAPLGQNPEVEEDTLEAYAVISAMGPTYFWFQLQAIRELAQEFGLTAPATDAALEAMVQGAVVTLLHGGSPPSEVMDLVPVRPMAEVEPAIRSAIETRLRAIHAKLRA